MIAHVWGAHDSRAGDDVLVIANFFFKKGHVAPAEDDCFGEAAETSTRAACAPQIT